MPPVIALSAYRRAAPWNTPASGCAERAGECQTARGVGIGYSIHAGMVIVADGTREADERLARVLTCDPGSGVVRHADAGYPEALSTAREHGVRIPMQETSR